MNQIEPVLAEIRGRVADRLYGSEAWGSKDPGRLDRIEAVIGRQLPEPIRELAVRFGNLLLPPFELNLLGSDSGPVGALAHTEDVRSSWRDLAEHCLVIGGSGRYLIVLLADDAVGLFDQDADPAHPPEVSMFRQPVELLRHVLRESEAIQRDPAGFF